MSSLHNKRILIFQQRGWAMQIGHFLAKKLQAEGCKLAALTLKRSTHDFIVNQEEVEYDIVVNNDEIMSDPKSYLGDDEISLEEVCRELAIDSIWPLIYTLRNHVKSYRDKYYYGFKQNVSDEDIVDYVKAVYKCIRHFFDNFNPELIISPNFVALPHIMFNLYASNRNVKMIGVTDCKVKGILIFTHGFQDDQGSFFKRVDELNERKSETNNREKAKKYIEEFRKNFKAPAYISSNVKKSIKAVIKDELRPYYQIARWYTKKQKNMLQTTGVTLDYLPPRYILRDHYCRKKYIRFSNKYDYFPFDKLEKYVYFPLQFQPEASIDVAAPYFSNQIETARLVAMSLPDDYTLVVKDHPAMLGYRPPSYIEKIARTPNVKLIDYRIPSEKVLRGADLVVSPNSTTLSEATFYWKPAIQLGDLGTTLKLPNVFKYTNMTTLSEKIKKLLSLDLKSDEYERKLENYIAAAYDAGFSFNYIGVWEKGEKEDMDNLWQLYKSEIQNQVN